VIVRFLTVARHELREARRYYEGQRPGLGREFAEEVRATVDRIRRLPEAWRPLSGRIRRCRTRRFPYGVLYAIEGDAILVVGVAHLHRDPQSWRDRL